VGTQHSNPRVSRLLLGVTAIEVLVLLVAGGGLLLLPGVLRAIWPWALTPFNAGFLGAVYLASMVAAASLVLIGRWSPARVVAPMILVFTAIVLAISLAYFDRFDWRNPSTWLWFALYIVIPVNAGYHVWRYWGLPPANPRPISSRWRFLLLTQGILFGAYGAGLLLAPAFFAAFWPWPVDDFHARLYSVAFITPALGAVLLARAAAREEALTLGLTQLGGGLLAIVSLLAVDASVSRVPWDASGTWAWLGTFAALFLLGLGLVWGARQLQLQR
jgi:hypothetical protein